MSTDGDDRDLCERFAEARRQEEQAVPAFARVLTAQPARRRVTRARLAAALVAGGALLVALLLPRPPQRPAPVPPITGWRSPTDFLLESPGREILRSLPRFGEGLTAPPDGADERRTSS